MTCVALISTFAGHMRGCIQAGSVHHGFSYVPVAGKASVVGVVNVHDGVQRDDEETADGVWHGNQLAGVVGQSGSLLHSNDNKRCESESRTPGTRWLPGIAHTTGGGSFLGTASKNTNMPCLRWVGMVAGMTNVDASAYSPLCCAHECVASRTHKATCLLVHGSRAQTVTLAVCRAANSRSAQAACTGCCRYAMTGRLKPARKQQSTSAPVAISMPPLDLGRERSKINDFSISASVIRSTSAADGKAERFGRAAAPPRPAGAPPGTPTSSSSEASPSSSDELSSSTLSSVRLVGPPPGAAAAAPPPMPAPVAPGAEAPRDSSASKADSLRSIRSSNTASWSS